MYITIRTYVLYACVRTIRVQSIRMHLMFVSVCVECMSVSAQEHHSLVAFVYSLDLHRK